MSLTTANVISGVEIALALFGAVLLWRLFLRPAAWARRPASGLAAWGVALPDFLLFIFFVICGSLAGAFAAGLIGRSLNLRGDAMTIVGGAGAQLGMLGGVVAYWARPNRGRPVVAAGGHVLLSGTVTFLVSLPLLLIAANLSEFLLKRLGLPTEKQSLIAMFANADSPLMLAIMIILAVVLAPLTEELVFRAGIFRYLRSRVPRWIALLGSALIFAALHVNWSTLEGLTSLLPLVVLAVMFSLSYEFTGSIGTPIIAHALFNLNTVMLIFSGISF